MCILFANRRKNIDILLYGKRDSHVLPGAWSWQGADITQDTRVISVEEWG